MTGRRLRTCDLRLGAGRVAGVLCLAVTCAALGLPGLAHAARKALVIGNDKYDTLRPLRNAAQDARDVAQALREAGFEVPDKWELQNAKRRDMGNALQDFLARIGEGDEVVFFFSGHGMEIDGQAALAPVDLPDVSRRPFDGSLRPLSEVEQAKRQVLDESLTVNRVATEIAQRGARFSLLIIDACRDNPVLEYLRQAHAASPTKNAAPPPTTGLIADRAADTQVLLFSASRGQQALDRLSDSDPVRNGVFTRVLLRHMRTPGLGLRAMLPLVKNDVKSLAASVRINGRPHVQEPVSMAAYEAPDFMFRPGAVAGSPMPAPVPAREPTLTPAARPAPTSSPGLADGQIFRDCAECPEMVVIPGGVLLPGDKPSSGRASLVGRRFAISRYEINQLEWQFLMGGNPSNFKNCGQKCPVESISWMETQEYIKKLNIIVQGNVYRLPSEAEWEYAARGGADPSLPFGTGQSISRSQANFDDSGGFGGNVLSRASSGTMKTGSFLPNGFGLFDVHGNVAEWVQDCYDDIFPEGRTPMARSEVESTNCFMRVIRGGSWASRSDATMLTSRSARESSSRAATIGFRIAKTLE